MWLFPIKSINAVELLRLLFVSVSRNISLREVSSRTGPFKAIAFNWSVVGCRISYSSVRNRLRVVVFTNRKCVISVLTRKTITARKILYLGLLTCMVNSLNICWSNRLLVSGRFANTVPAALSESPQYSSQLTK